MPIFKDDPHRLERFRAGDQRVLTEVYQAYRDKVRQGLVAVARVRRATGPSIGAVDIVDILQDTFSKAFSEAGRRGYDEARPYGPYLQAIARNVMNDWFRRRGRELPAEVTLLELEAVTVPCDDDPWDGPEIVGLVERYVRGLPAALGELHRRRYVEGASQDDAAAALGLSRQNVRTLEAQLRDGLRRAMQAAGVEIHTLTPTRKRSSA
jgi:RNA polymerase sigma factor (sigma-70 family)